MKLMTDLGKVAHDFPRFGYLLQPIPAQFHYFEVATHRLQMLGTGPAWKENHGPVQPQQMVLHLHTRQVPNCTHRVSLYLYDNERILRHVITRDVGMHILYWVQWVGVVRELGLGFHIDTRGKDYVGPGDAGPIFDPIEADGYDRLIRFVVGQTRDPYTLTTRLWEILGLVKPDGRSP